MKYNQRKKTKSPLYFSAILIFSVAAALSLTVTLATAAPGGIITSPPVAPGPALPAAPIVSLGSLKQVPLWNELQQMLEDPNDLSPNRRRSYLPDHLPGLKVHPLDINPFTGEPLTLDPATGKISWDVPAYGVSDVDSSDQLVDQTGIRVTSLPKPVNENDFILDRDNAAVVGKALFWDMQVGSDGVQACGSCHFHAGADDRIKNSLNPDMVGGDLTLQVAPPNGELQPKDFPFHKLDDPTVPGEPALNPGNNFSDVNDVVSSMGVRYRRFVDVPVGAGAFFTDPSTGISSLLPDIGTEVADPVPVFQGLRRVPPRNSPSVIGAVFNFDNFWDGRARNEFNGGSVFGASDPYFHVFVNDGTPGGAISTLADPSDPSNPALPIRIQMSSLASQATGPALNSVEMSFDGRNWAKIGKRLLQPGVVPLANQRVDPSDSVLGPWSNQGGSKCPSGSTASGKPGLCTTYGELIQSAFKPEFLANSTAHLNGADNPADTFDEYSLSPGAGAADPANTGQFTQAEANFSLFFGLGVQLYEQLLIPDDTPFDRFMDLNPDAFKGALDRGRPANQLPPPQPPVSLVPGFNLKALLGLDFFQNSNLSGLNPQFKGDNCNLCHSGPELASSTVSTAFGLAAPEFTPVVKDPSQPIPAQPVKIVSGFMLADAVNSGAKKAVEIENANVAANEVIPGAVNSLLDEGMYNVGVTPAISDSGRGGNDAFGWPLSRALMALKNLGGPGFEPGAPMSTFDPDAGPAGLSTPSRGGGLFAPTPAYQRWLTGTGPLNPGLSPKPVNPLLPPYLAPWTSNLPEGEAHPQLDELNAAPNTLSPPPDVLFGPNPACTFGTANSYPGGPAGFGPDCPNLVSGITNDKDIPLIGTWPFVNRVSRSGGFKVPGLRNVELTGPYFHNGGKLTLQQVVSFYDRGGDFPKTNADNLDPAMQISGGHPELVDFMLALTDDRVKYERAPFDHPELFVPVDGSAPDNTGGRPFLLGKSSGAGAMFRQIPAVGSTGNAQPLRSFMGISSTPVPGANNDQFDDLVPTRYFWNYYDSKIMKSWLLMGNPADSTASLELGLLIGNKRMGLGDLGAAAGNVPPGKTLSFFNSGLADGPAVASSRTQQPAVVSQRSLMGDSFEEIPGTDFANRSRHFYWTWYDMQSAGFKDWIIVTNPDPVNPVAYEIKIAGISVASGNIPPGGMISPTFPGRIGGPVEVITGREVFATQRVLSNNGTAFNEVPGMPIKDLAKDFVWTWYDMRSPGFLNWVLIANPDTEMDVNYEIRIAGKTVGTGNIPPGGMVHPTFRGQMGGPVEVITDHEVIASQRVTAGPSFEEVPGQSLKNLVNKYYWTWYDMTTGFRNWVIINNPDPVNSVTYEIKINGNRINSGSIPAGGSVTPTFPNQIGGPVEVSASAPVMASQRVTRNGHFNEVLGQEAAAAAHG